MGPLQPFPPLATITPTQYITRDKAYRSGSGWLGVVKVRKALVQIRKPAVHQEAHFLSLVLM